MEETVKKKVLELIKQSIDEVVYDEVKQIPARLKAKHEEQTKTKAQRDQDAHNALFGSKDDEISFRIRLHESNDKPTITSEELNQFENEFKSRFPGISFDKQVGAGKNGQIVDFPVISGQNDAVTSGKIISEKDVLSFTMSLSNGLKIASVIINGRPKPFEINKSTKDIFGKMLNLYEKLFKERFNQIINPSSQPEASPPAPAPAAPAPAAQAAPGTTTTPPTTPAD